MWDVVSRDPRYGPQWAQGTTYTLKPSKLNPLKPSPKANPPNRIWISCSPVFSHLPQSVIKSLFKKIPDLYCRAPESGGLWYKFRQFKTVICPPSEGWWW